MSFYTWLFAVKKFSDLYSKVIERYRELPEDEKAMLYEEYCSSGYEEN